jgi:phosphoserine phosphatase RsbU/P
MASLNHDFTLPLNYLNHEVTPIAVLLVSDEAWVYDTLQRILKDHQDIGFFYCCSTSQIIEKALKIKPTVIIQDIALIGGNGFELIKRFRAHPSTRDVPIIVFADQEDKKNKIDSFRAGGNDYLIKIPDPYELVARLRYHSENYIRFLERNEAYRQLKETGQALHNDLIEAAAYVYSLLPEPSNEGVNADWVFIPSAYLGGDTFDYYYPEEDLFVFCIVDVCGHGVGSALLSLSILNYIRSISYTPNLMLGDVLDHLNQVFPMEKNNNMFFSVFGGVYNMKTRELQYTSGGHPPGIVIRNKKAIELTINQIMVGVDSDAKYQSHTVVLEENDILYIFSDGVYEVENQEGVQLGLKRFVSFLIDLKPEDSLDDLVESIRAWTGENLFEDDFSLIRIRL